MLRQEEIIVHIIFDEDGGLRMVFQIFRCFVCSDKEGVFQYIGLHINPISPSYCWALNAYFLTAI